MADLPPADGDPDVACVESAGTAERPAERAWSPGQATFETSNGVASYAGRWHGSMVFNDHRGSARGVARSGAVAAMLDDVLVCSVQPCDSCAVVTIHMEVDYLDAVPLGARLAVTCWSTHREGRRLFGAGALYTARMVLAQDTATFLLID